MPSPPFVWAIGHCESDNACDSPFSIDSKILWLCCGKPPAGALYGRPQKKARRGPILISPACGFGYFLACVIVCVFPPMLIVPARRTRAEFAATL